MEATMHLTSWSLCFSKCGRLAGRATLGPAASAADGWLKFPPRCARWLSSLSAHQTAEKL